MIGKVVLKSTHTGDDAKVSPGKWKTVPHLSCGEKTGYLCIQFGNDKMSTTEALKPADARLMAASKELLQGLKNVVETMRKCQVQYPPTTFVYDELEAIAQQAKAIIAKAGQE
jgi:hypothetical protein